MSILPGSHVQTRPTKSNKVKLACQRCRDKRTKVDATRLVLTESIVRTYLFHSATGKDPLAPNAPKPGRRVSMSTLMALEASLVPLSRMHRPG